MSAFEDRLWTYLADVHRADDVNSKRATAPRGRWAAIARTRRPHVAITAGALGVIAAAAVAVVLLVSATAARSRHTR